MVHMVYILYISIGNACRIEIPKTNKTKIMKIMNEWRTEEAIVNNSTIGATQGHVLSKYLFFYLASFEILVDCFWFESTSRVDRVGVKSIKRCYVLISIVGGYTEPRPRNTLKEVSQLRF